MNRPLYLLNKDEIDSIIEKHLPIKQLEKEKYGEVFTPTLLIHKMLDLFPPNVWSNHSLKWLDPTCGTGNFLLCIYQRLMTGLENWQTNKSLRSKHIISKMLIMCEINKSNCKICKGIFGKEINLLCGNFLDDFDRNNEAFFSKEFDMIVGNPPFKNEFKNKKILGGKSKLYERIFLKSFSILKKNGYLSFIVPDNIFSGNSSLSYQLILKNKIPFVSFDSSNQSFFPTIQQDICYFLLCKNESSNTKTCIVNRDGSSFYVELEDRPVNPVRNWTANTEKLIRKFVSSIRNNVVYNRGHNLHFYKGNKYPLIYLPDKIIYTNKIGYAIGLGIKKVVIFAISTKLEFKMDYEGKYGVGPNTFYIPFDNFKEGKMYERFFNSDEYKIMALATKTTRLYLKIGFIEHLNLTKILQYKNDYKSKSYKRKLISSKNKTKKIY